jgi:heme-degrading monooxygenase HmoA
MPFVSITRLRVRSWRFLPMFVVLALRSARQSDAAEGNLATKLLADQHNTFWTVTLWTSDAAMRAYMLAGVHRSAMRKLPHWCDEAAVVHWNQDTNELPSWHEAWGRLLRDGRRSKVDHPTPAHASHQLPQPRVRPRAERRYK